MFENLRELLDRFSDVKILVVGDVMLDRYWWGSVSRISPEAPVPVVKLEKTSVTAGGAANVALNISGLGARAFLIGSVGDDAESRALSQILEDRNVSSEFLFKTKGKPTIVKTRIVAHNQHVVRIDQEESAEIDAYDEKKIWRLIERVLEQVDLVVVSDYAKGLLTETLLTRLITQSIGMGKKILVDPKGKDFTKYKNATVLTPNRREAIDACGLEDKDHLDLTQAGKKLLETLNLETLLITQGEKGMSLFRKNANSLYFPASARKVYDVTGAGDTVIASFAVAVAANLDYEQAAEIANLAAGLVVEEVGTTVITKEKLTEHLSKNPE